MSNTSKETSRITTVSYKTAVDCLDCICVLTVVIPGIRTSPARTAIEGYVVPVSRLIDIANESFIGDIDQPTDRHHVAFNSSAGRARPNSRIHSGENTNAVQAVDRRLVGDSRYSRRFFRSITHDVTAQTCNQLEVVAIVGTAF